MTRNNSSEKNECNDENVFVITNKNILHKTTQKCLLVEQCTDKRTDCPLRAQKGESKSNSSLTQSPQ